VRVWIVSFLLVAGVVAGVLHVTRGDEPTKEPPPRAAPPRTPLQEGEVRAYLTVMPAVNAQNQANAAEFADIWQKTGQYPNDPAMAMRHRAAVETILQKHGYTTGTFQRLRERVEVVVDILRWESDATNREAEFDRRIKEREEMLESATGAVRTQIERDLAQLKERRKAAPPPLHESDRELVTRFWAQLDPLAPRVGPAPSGGSK